MTVPLEPGSQVRTMAVAIVPVGALVADRCLGEPPVLHPVVGMGHLLDVLARGRDHLADPRATAVAGGVALAGALAVVGAVAVALERALVRLPSALAVPLESLALSTLLSDALLRDEAAAVEVALDEDLVTGRQVVARLVSRETATLDADEVRAAAVESMAENTGDSVVGPFLAWGIAGLPGATAYRLVNTADAMWGYRGEPWEWWGKAAARLDDLCNLVPARFAACLLAPAATTGWLRDQAARTPSPNAGWPMAAVAGRFGLRLPKPGVYVLNELGRAPRTGDIARVAGAVRAAANGAALVAAGMSALRAARWGRRA